MLALPLLPALYLWLLRRRARSALVYASLRVVREAAGRSWRRHIPPALIFGALALLLLAGSLAAAGWFVRPKDRARDRDAMYRAWVMRALAAFWLPVLVSLAVLDGWRVLTGLPLVFQPVRDVLPTFAPGNIVAGALGGTVLGLAVAAWRARTGGRPIGRPGALMPRDRRELPWGIVVAIVAVLANLVADVLYATLDPRIRIAD